MSGPYVNVKSEINLPCSTIIYSENNKLFTYQTRALHHVLTFGSMTERKKHILHFVEFKVHMTLKISIFANFQNETFK